MKKWIALLLAAASAAVAAEAGNGNWYQNGLKLVSNWYQTPQKSVKKPRLMGGKVL